MKSRDARGQGRHAGLLNPGDEIKALLPQFDLETQEVMQPLTLRAVFAPALANFKLVQERIRERAELQKVGRLPLSAVRVPSAIVAEARPTAAGPPSADQQEISTQKNSEDKP